MFVLDCGSQDTTLNSLANGFSCSRERLIEVLLSADLQQIPNTVLPEEFLYEFVTDYIGPPRRLDKVCWFHGTRTLKSNTFSEGIKPLGIVLDELWEMLFSYAPNTYARQGLKMLRDEGFEDAVYNLKVQKSHLWGPYATLVREVVFSTQKLGLHDYLKMPELIEDICNAYQRRFGTPIIEHYVECLTPKLVKFISDRHIRNDYVVGSALGYAYLCANDLGLSRMVVRNFDGRGQTIEADCILEIEIMSD